MAPVSIERIPENDTVAPPLGESDSAYHDLVNFLSSPRSDVRRAAAEAVLAMLASSSPSSSSSLGHSQHEKGDSSISRENHSGGNEEAARRLTSLSAVQPLCKIASEMTSGSPSGSLEALASLSVLCSHDLVGNQCIEDFLDARGIGRMLEICLSAPPGEISGNTSGKAPGETSGKAPGKAVEQWKKQVNFGCALLANATRTERGAVDFIGAAFPKEAVPSSSGSSSPRQEKPSAALLLARFLNPNFVDPSSALAHSDPPIDSDFEDDDDDDSVDFNIDEQKNDGRTMVQPEEHHDPYQHVASIMMNITQLDMGRNFLMKLIHTKNNQPQTTEIAERTENSTSHLQSLLPQLQSPNVHRRRGIAGTCKNCCFSRDSAWWLLHVVRIDKSLLLPLAGPEQLTIDEKVGLDPDYWLQGPSKRREPDPLVRLRLVEALLLLLASGRRARETMRERRAYVVIKMADMVEEDEMTSERMLECVQYLRRDEEGEEEGSSDKRAYESYARGLIEGDAKQNAKSLIMSTVVDDYDAID